MLRRTENVQVFYQRDLWGLLTGRYKILLQVGKREHLSGSRVTKAEFRELEERSASLPVMYMRIGERSYWRYAGKWHTDNENLDQESVAALLVTRSMRDADRLNRAKTIAAQGQLPTSTQRQRIPDDVKQLVWSRDGGTCQTCGSKSELQFDHIIPVAHGGGNGEANIQVLCGPCNRRKSAGLTVATPPPSQPLPVAPTPAANWYPDPLRDGTMRYWDGQAWTDHTHDPQA